MLDISNQNYSHRLLTMFDANINLVGVRDLISSDNIKTRFGSNAVVCDVPVLGSVSELYKNIPVVDGILNIDHHHKFPHMERFISSGNIAAQYVREHGSLGKEVPIVINHTDCDSIISSLIMSGFLPPEKIFEDAVIAADHTGAKNEIADLLQSMDPLRSVESSARNLALLLSGLKLDSHAEELLGIRNQKRVEAQKIVSAGDYNIVNCVSILEIEDRIPGELLLDYFKSQAVMLTIRKLGINNYEYRLRVCQGAPEGFSLLKLGIRDFDPNFGGRWNAGSNRRSGGSEIQPLEYITLLNQRVNQLVESLT